MLEILEKIHANLSLPENKREGYSMCDIWKCGFGSGATYSFDSYSMATEEGDKFEVVLDWQNKPIAIKWSKLYGKNREVLYKKSDVYFTEYVELVTRGNAYVIAKFASNLQNN